MVRVETVGEPRPWLAVLVSAGLSAIPIAGGPVQTFFDAIEERRRAGARQTVIEIADIVGGVDALVSRMEDHPDLQDLLVRGVEAAFRSSYEAKRTLLARAVASAFENDEAIDPATLTVMALSQLEPVHVRTLARLARVASEADSSDDALTRHNAVGIASQSEPAPVRATLIYTGVVTSSAAVAGYTGGDGVQLFDVTDFGHQIIRELRDAGDHTL